MFFNRNKVMILVKKFTIILVLTVFFLSGILAKPADTLAPAFAEDKIIDLERFAGKTRYETALKIAGENWTNASGVVLARGDAFPDALAGAVLANSSGINGPLLLTDSKYLRTDILLEIKRLGASKVYILGGTGAISGQVEQSLRTNGIEPVRIDGADRFGTAAKIAAASMETSTRAFLVSGEKFADALSISSYAAAKGIPLLLTKVKKVPPETMNTLKELGVTDITLIGGTGVISPDIEEYLKQSGYNVGRLSGTDRYETNTAILKALDYNLDKMIAATGTSFPDALAGSVLAARNNNPIVLVPNDVDKIVSATTGSYMNDNRHLVNKFVLLGGSAVLSYTVESFIVSGKTNPRISLQFWDGYGSRTSYERQLQYVPDNFTDHIHILSPNFGGSLQEDGSFGYAFPDAAIPKYLVSLGQSKGAKVVPLIYDDKKLASEVLRSPEKRKNFVDSAVKMVEETNADGFLFDLELLADDTGPGLNSLMQDLYGRLNPKGKLVMISVMSKTSDTAEPWTAEYNYRELAKIGWLTDGKINAAGKIQAMITNLAGPEVTRYDPLLINKAFAWVAQNVFLGMPALTDALVVIFEIGIGIAMILGLGVFWAALAAMFLNTQFIAGASFINFGYIWTNLIMVLFARHAELLGLGGYIRYLRTGDALPGSKRKTEMRERY